ncbi:MAG: alpha/beta fold hydrolase [Opitutaceae bacterium]
MQTAEKASIPDWLAGEYPFAPRNFRTPAGARMSFLDEGPRGSEAVLMLHGNPTWSFHYRHLVRELAPSMRCVVPDHVGMGLSEKPERYDYTLARRIEDLEMLVASLALKRVHLIVHDWGGAIGFGFAARHPELIGSIVILNTAAFASPRIPFRIRLCKLPLVGPLLVRGANGFAWPATWMAMHRRALTTVEKRGYLWPYGSWRNRVAVSAFVRDIPLRPSHPSWPALIGAEQGLAGFRAHDVLIIWGGRDFCFNDHFLARWQTVFLAAAVHRIADAGHYVLEDAREEVIPRIGQFLRSTRPG